MNQLIIMALHLFSKCDLLVLWHAHVYVSIYNCIFLYIHVHTFVRVYTSYMYVYTHI
jgi:hypothetical protein